MVQKGLLQSQALYEYILDTTVYPRELVFLKEIREATASHPLALMGTAPEEGPLLEMLLKTINAEKTIEIGVFTGYSLLLTALSIPDNGKILAIDMDRAAFNIGLPIIKKAGVDHKSRRLSRFSTSYSRIRRRMKGALIPPLSMRIRSITGITTRG